MLWLKDRHFINPFLMNLSRAFMSRMNSLQRLVFEIPGEILLNSSFEEGEGGIQAVRVASCLRSRWHPEAYIPFTKQFFTLD
jgi:hypothetical protein